jgi:protocatechuate 3,4-dioxygenase beta subunit
MGIRSQVATSGTTDADGRFSFSFSRTGERVYWDQLVIADAAGVVRTVRSIPAVSGTIPDQLIRFSKGGVAGRVIGPDSKPMADAVVQVRNLGGAGFYPAGANEKLVLPPLWPASVKTGPDGRFLIPDLDPNIALGLETRDPRNGMPAYLERKENRGKAPEGTIRFEPFRTRTLSGKVIAADTKKPIPHAVLTITPAPVAYRGGLIPLAWTAKADAEGQFSVEVLDASRWLVRAEPAELSLKLDPYLGTACWIDAKAASAPMKGAGANPPPLTANMSLPRGVLAEGRVVDAATGKPIPFAKVGFLTRLNGMPREQGGMVIQTVGPAMGLTGPDGDFSLAVPDVAGVLVATAADLNYLPAEVDPAFTGGAMIGVQAVVPFKAGETAQLSLKQGRRIEAAAVLPDGKPVPEGFVTCYHALGGPSLRSFAQLPVQNGRFDVPACQPGLVYTFLIYMKGFPLGAIGTLECPNTIAEKPAVVRLQPLGSMTVKVLDESGNPVSGCVPSISVCLPAAKEAKAKLAVAGTASARWLNMSDNLFMARTGANGLAKINGLIPGAVYRVAVSRDGVVGWAEVTIPADGNADATVALPPSPVK